MSRDHQPGPVEAEIIARLEKQRKDESGLRGCLTLLAFALLAVGAIVAAGVAFAVVFLVLPQPLQGVVGLAALIVGAIAWFIARATR